MRTMILAAGIAAAGFLAGNGPARAYSQLQAQGITEASQIIKTVRVVSTVDYFLRN